MYSLETLKHLNDLESLKFHLTKHPLKKIRSAVDTKKSPDYSGIDIDLLEKASGLKLIEEYFIDASGFGAENEPAYTFSCFVEIVKSILNQGKEIYSCLTGIGQFQVYIGLFEKVAK